MLSDLRESGSLEQDADIVMFIHKVTDEIPERNVDPENEQQRELIELMVAKHRNGPTKDIQMMFIKNLAQFYDILPENRYKK
jgi:replicative DNA helicase